LKFVFAASQRYLMQTGKQRGDECKTMAERNKAEKTEWFPFMVLFEK